jgi:glycosyltransferase involved in cell wall biosynthesis
MIRADANSVTVADLTSPASLEDAETPGPPPVASVVIPTRDRRTSVLRTVSAIRAVVPADGRLEIIVVDNGSADGTPAAVEAWAQRDDGGLRLVEERRPGRGAACDRGARLARGRILILLDDDMEPGPGWLERHVAHHERPGFGVVGAAPSAGRARWAAGRYLQDRFDRHLTKLQRSGIGTIRDVYTGNFSIERSRFLDVGGFDPAFVDYGGEDGELAVRLLAAGTTLIFAADAVARQHQDKDLDSAVQDARSKGRNAVLLTRRHPEVRPTMAFARPGSRRRRAVRRPLGWVLRSAPRSIRLLEPALEALDRIAPGLAARGIELVLDAAYTIGARDAVAAPSDVAARSA